MEEQGKEKTRVTWKDFFNIHSLIYAIIAIILSCLLMLIPYAVQDWKFNGFIDGTFLGGAFSLGFGLLFLAGNDGTFDIISLGFSDLVSVIKRNGSRKYKGLFEYREEHKLARKSKRFAWLAFELVGVIFILISVICYFTFYR